MTKAFALAASILSCASISVAQAGGKAGIDPGTPAKKGVTATERKAPQPTILPGEWRKGPESAKKKSGGAAGTVATPGGGTKGIEANGTEAQGVDHAS